MMKFGNISDIDASKGLAKVCFDGDGDTVTSDWLPIAVMKSLKDQFTYMFDVNDHVCCIMDDNCEAGVILCAIYDSKNKPGAGNADKINVTFSDNTLIEYDRATHKLTVNVAQGDVEITAKNNVKVTCQQATVTAQTSVKIDSPNTEITGMLKVDQDLTVLGKADVTGDVSGGGGVVTLLTHLHISGAPGSSTGPPTG